MKPAGKRVSPTSDGGLSPVTRVKQSGVGDTHVEVERSQVDPFSERLNELDEQLDGRL